MDIVIVKQRTLEELSRDNVRSLAKRDEPKPIPVNHDAVYNLPPTTFTQPQPQPQTQYNMPPPQTLPYNIGVPVPLQLQQPVPKQYVPQQLPTTYMGQPTTGMNYPGTVVMNPNPTPPTTFRSAAPTTGIYPVMKQPVVLPATTPTNNTNNTNKNTPPRVTVKFDERLIGDAVSMGFDRQTVVDTLYELYGTGQPANDINVLMDRLANRTRA